VSVIRAIRARARDVCDDSAPSRAGTGTVGPARVRVCTWEATTCWPAACSCGDEPGLPSAASLERWSCWHAGCVSGTVTRSASLPAVAAGTRRSVWLIATLTPGQPRIIPRRACVPKMARAAAAATRVYILVDGAGHEPLPLKWYGSPTAAEIATNVRRLAGLGADDPLDVRGECARRSFGSTQMSRPT
jgi:hypothetical protein